MSHYALVNENNIVVQVIVADRDPTEWEHTRDMALKCNGKWIQTSYNTRMGVHYGPDGNPDGGVALRMNFAGIGFTYDAQLDAFIPPKPAASWVLDPQRGVWNPPHLPPDDGNYYVWDVTIDDWRIDTRPRPAGVS